MSDTSSIVSDKVPKEGKFKFVCWSPSCMQWGNNATGFLVVLSLFITIATFVTSGIVNINVTSIERRFGLDSADSGLVLVGYDIAFCLLTVFVTYFGDQTSRPRVVGAGCFVFGLGALVYALPHFLTPEYLINDDELQIVCPLDPSSVSEGCSSSSADLHDYMWVLFAGEMLMGAGATPMFTLGLTYIEDSVSKNAAPIYLGIANSMAVVGPMIGFLVGGEFLFKYFVDFENGKDPGITVLDPRWIGAWWMGPLIATGVCVILFIPLTGFPKQLPGTNDVRAKRVSEVHKDGGGDEAKKRDFGKSIKDIPWAFWILIRNPTFTIVMLGGCCQAILINGVSAFMAKFIENEFHLTAGRAAQISGAVLVPSGALGHIVAGIIINRMQWNARGMLRFSAISLLVVVALVPVGFLSCNSATLAGVTQAYTDNNLTVGELTSTCNAHCECQEEFYIPVCDSNNVTYFSPCHAGCYDYDNSTKTYLFCQCTPDFVATSGACTTPCTTLGGFLAGMFFAIMLSFFPLTPSLLIYLRVVPESLRTFGLGVQWLFVRLIGTIPGPLIFGAAIDVTCSLWQKRRCDGTRGSCWLYDNDKLATNFVILSMAGNFMAACFFFVAGQCYKQERDEPGALEEQKEDGKKIYDNEKSLPGSSGERSDSDASDRHRESCKPESEEITHL